MNFETQSAIVAFGINLFLAVYVLVKRQGWRSTINRNFSILSLAFAIWNLGVAVSLHIMLHFGLFIASPALYLFL